MKKIIKSHIFIGFLSIVIGLIISFGLTPIYSAAIEKKGEVVIVRKSIKAGQLIRAEDIECVQVGIFNLSDKVIRQKNMVIGKYAKIAMLTDMYVLKDSISDKPMETDLYLNEIPEDKFAISVTVQNYAAGLSSKLLRGDIVSVVVKRKDDDGMILCEMPDSLMYMEVLSTTQESGIDKVSVKADIGDKKTDEVEKLATVTLLANKQQVSELSSYEGEAVIHLALKSRNDAALKQKLLLTQETYFEELEKEAEELRKEEEEKKKEVDNINSNEGTDTLVKH